MQPYDKVKVLVDQGNISITYIDHLPRTTSHALARCLYEIYDAEINEPFFSSRNNGTEAGFAGLDPACDLILKEYAREHDKDPAKKPVTILVKDVAKSLPGRYWDKWLNLTGTVVTLVRDPHVQLFSLMEAIANDHLNPGEEKVSRDQVLQYGEVIGRALRLNGTKELNTTSWRPLHEHLLQLRDHPDKRHIVIDANLLLLDPETCVEALVSKLDHVTFKRSMLSDWEKSRRGFSGDRDWGKSAVETDSGKKNAWTNEAFGRDGFGSPSAVPTQIGELPEILQAHMEGQALPAYLYALQHASRMGPKTIQEAIKLLNKPVGTEGRSFRSVNPTTAYALISSCNSSSQQYADMVLRDEYLASLRKENPSYSASFDCMDRLMGKAQARGNLRS